MSKLSDVETYGLFAVILVGGMLLVIAVQGGFSGEPPARPEVIVAAASLSAPAAAPGAAQDAAPVPVPVPRVVKVRPILPDTPFQWNEPPVKYPGERSAEIGLTAEGGETLAEALGAVAAPPPAEPAQAPPAASASVSASARAPAAGKPRTHTIAAGETLGAIAAKHLGSSAKWPELVALNPGLDPKRLKIGAVIALSAPGGGAAATAVQPAAPAAAKPAAKAAAKPAPAAARTHTVKSGDTLGEIARMHLGSSRRADELFAANRDVLASKDELKVGQVLKLPSP